jgi:3-dehydroquinate synthase
MIEIPVELGERRYPIIIGRGVARLLPDVLSSLRGRRLVLVSSPPIYKLHGRTVERSLSPLGRVQTLLIPSGERFKTRATLEHLHDRFLAKGLARDGCVVALGGGVVGDVAGFAAATYMRGVPWVVVPTTLLAMVDSAIGGKVGVNHPQAKNLLGAFHQPRAVIVDPAFLATLPAREAQSGAYEVLKYGVLDDRDLFLALEKAPADLRTWSLPELENAIATSCRIKATVVEKDEHERGLRKTLNLGHTLGHAFEAVTAYRRFTHGEAVGSGLVGASFIARERGLLADSVYLAIARAVDRRGPRPRVSDLPPSLILEAVSRDKKSEAGRVLFILPTRIGRVVMKPDVRPAEIRRALRALAAGETRRPARPGSGQKSR